MKKLNVRKGDNVIVLTGKDKGKKGVVLSARPDDNAVSVDGVNVIIKHVKPRGPQKPGGIQKEPGNIDVSNVMIVCNSCGKPTRVAHKEIDGKNARICKKCGLSLDKGKVAAAKKEKKAVKKAKSDEKPADTAAPAAEEQTIKKTARKTKKAE